MHESDSAGVCRSVLSRVLSWIKQNREHTPPAWLDTLSFEGIKHVSVSHMKLKDMNLVLESLLQHRNIDILKYHIKYHSEAIVSKDSFIREWSNRTLASPLA